VGRAGRRRADVGNWHSGIARAAGRLRVATLRKPFPGGGDLNRRRASLFLPLSQPPVQWLRLNAMGLTRGAKRPLLAFSLGPFSGLSLSPVSGPFLCGL